MRGPAAQVLQCLRGQVPEIADWQAVLLTANENWLVPAIYVALDRSARLELLPEDVRSFLTFIHSRNCERNARLLKQLEEILLAFNRAGIEPTLMKGTIHLFTAPPERFGARMMADLDLMLSRAELPVAEACLRELGRKRIGGLGWGRKTDVGCVDLHYPPGALAEYFPSIDALTARAERCERNGATARIPSPAQRAAHIVVHDLIKDGDWWLGKLDLRHALELAELIDVPPGLDWPALLHAMPDELSRSALELALITVRELFGAKVPAAAISGRISARWQFRRVLFQLDHPTLSAPVKAAGYLAWTARRLRVEWRNRGDGALFMQRALRKAGESPKAAILDLVTRGRGPKL